MIPLIRKTELLRSSGLGMEYFPDYTNKSQQMHAIDTVLISIILKGSCLHYIDEKVYKEGPGDAGIIHYHQKHRLLPTASIDHMNIYLDPKKMDFSPIPSSLHSSLAEILPFEADTVHNFNRIIHFRFADIEKVKTLLFLMADEYKKGRGKGENNGLLMNYFSLISAEIVRSLKTDQYGLSQKINSPHKPVFGVLTWLDEHYTEPVDGETLAAMVGWSHSWLCRNFKKTVGMTIQDYIINKRISRAIFYILNTNQTMLSIALDVGFRDVNFFNKKFKELTGLSPGNYRKRNRSEEN